MSKLCSGIFQRTIVLSELYKVQTNYSEILLHSRVETRLLVIFSSGLILQHAVSNFSLSQGEGCPFMATLTQYAKLSSPYLSLLINAVHVYISLFQYSPFRARAPTV